MTRGFVFLQSYFQALRPLPDGERLALLDAILDFAFEGKEPDGLPPLLNGYFSLLRPNIESGIRRYNAAVTNGKGGGRPPKKPTETQQKPNKNPTETQTKPTENLDKDKDMDMDKDKDSETADKSPTLSRKRFGQYGWIRLTEVEYSKLLSDLGQNELDRCIQYIDESSQGNGNKNRWKDWNLVLRRCSREGWGRRSDGMRETPAPRAKKYTIVDGEAVEVSDNV